MIDSQTPLPGTPMEELDTPCLVLDLNALDNNIDVIADYYRDRSSKLRGHSKNHKTPGHRAAADTPRWHRRRGLRRQGR